MLRFVGSLTQDAGFHTKASVQTWLKHGALWMNWLSFCEEEVGGQWDRGAASCTDTTLARKPSFAWTWALTTVEVVDTRIFPHLVWCTVFSFYNDVRDSKDVVRIEKCGWFSFSERKKGRSLWVSVSETKRASECFCLTGSLGSSPASSASTD